MSLTAGAPVGAGRATKVTAMGGPAGRSVSQLTSMAAHRGSVRSGPEPRPDERPAHSGGRSIRVLNCIDRYGHPAGPAGEASVFHWLTTMFHSAGVDPGIGQPQ